MPIFIKFVPVDGKFVALVKTIVVVDELMAPSKVVVCGLATVPLYCPKPQPNPGNCSAGPTG